MFEPVALPSHVVQQSPPNFQLPSPAPSDASHEPPTLSPAPSSRPKDSVTRLSHRPELALIVTGGNLAGRVPPLQLASPELTPTRKGPTTTASETALTPVTPTANSVPSTLPPSSSATPQVDPLDLAHRDYLLKSRDDLEKELLRVKLAYEQRIIELERDSANAEQRASNAELNAANATQRATEAEQKVAILEKRNAILERQNAGYEKEGTDSEDVIMRDGKFARLALYVSRVAHQ